MSPSSHEVTRWFENQGYQIAEDINLIAINVIIIETTITSTTKTITRSYLTMIRHNVFNQAFNAPKFAFKGFNSF